MLALIRSFFSRLFAGRPATQASIDEELQCHLELEVEENLRCGMRPEEARRRALIALGGLQQAREDYREAWAVRWLQELGQDARYALRGMAGRPGFTATLFLVLSLGIAASSVMFTVVDRLLLNPVPFPNASRMISFPLLGTPSTETLDYWGGQNHAFEKVALYGGGAVGLSAQGNSERLQVARATLDLFSILGVQPLFGRTFSSDEEVTGKDAVVVLSYEFWKRTGGDRAILGRTVKLNNVSHQVIGVMPPGCQFPPQTDVWIPMAFGPARRAVEFDPEPYGKYEGGNVGLLRTGVTLDQAQAEHRVIWNRFDAETHTAGDFQRLVPLEQRISRTLAVPVLALFGAVLCILAITCANAASLLLAHAAARRHEISVRACLGASRARLLRQLLTESVLLALSSGVCGLLLAFGAMHALRVVGGAYVSRLADIALNSNVLAFALGVTLVAGLFLGFAPALQSLPANVGEGLKAEANRAGATIRQRLRKGLVLVQIALAVVLAVGASLMLRTLSRALNLDRGFSTEHVLTARVALPALKYADQQRRAAYWASLQDALMRLSGVTSAGMTETVPLESGGGMSLDLGQPRGRFPRYVIAGRRTIAGDYFGAMGIRVLAGRAFDERDAPNAPKTIIISECLARAISPSGNPVGSQIRMEGETVRREIVGVVNDVDTISLRGGPAIYPEVQFYLPYTQQFRATSIAPLMTNVMLRTSGDPEPIVPALQKLVVSLDPEARLYQARTMNSIASDVVAGPRFNAMLLFGFGLAALGLAALGVYGVVSYSVTCRRHEIGVRVSLGARRADILRMVAGEGTRMGLTGLLVGLLGSLALTRLISSLLFHVEPTDPVSFIGACACLLAVVFVASLIPARRAARLDPLAALRHE